MQDREREIRRAAFEWLDEQVREGRQILPRRPLLEKGFPWPPDQSGGLLRELPASYQDGSGRISMMAQHGIFKPQQCTVPLTITTTQSGPYADRHDKQTGMLLYNYAPKTPKGEQGNEGLRRAMEERLPLVYFRALRPGLYLPIYPTYVVADDRQRRVFSVVLDEVYDLASTNHDPASTSVQYRNRLVRDRVDQPAFRDRVLRAYNERCTVCNLGHTSLLEAAHIKPYSEDGPPVVTNGMAMCHLHHGAYDAKLIGISPDLKIEIHKKIMTERDGPTLEYSLKGLDEHFIKPPRQSDDHPNREWLDARWQEFKAAN